MNRQYEGIKTNNDGFTLLEVLVAMIILTVVCVPLLRSFATSAQTSAKAKIQSQATMASENIMEEIRNMSTEDLCETFSGATDFSGYPGAEDITFKLVDNSIINLGIPDGYYADVALNAITTSGAAYDDAYPNANSLNMADFSPISVRDCAIYTMDKDYDKEAYEWYKEKSAEYGTNKDEDYFKKNLTRNIIVTIEDTGVPYTDDEGNTKNAVKVKIEINYYCNPANIVDGTRYRTYVKTSAYLFDNSTTHKDFNGIYIFYYPRYTAANRGDSIRRDVMVINNSRNVKTDVYAVAMNNGSSENDANRTTYMMANKGLKMFINENDIEDGKAGISLKTNLLKTSATTGLRTPYSTYDGAGDYGLGLDISFKAGTRRAYNTPTDTDDLCDELSIADVDGKAVKADTNVRIYRVTVDIVKSDGSESTPLSKMEGTKLRHE